MSNKVVQPDGSDITTLYGGEVQLVFDPSDHSYTIDGRPLLGVTSINSILDKPELVKWAARMGSEYFLECMQKFSDRVRNMLSGAERMDPLEQRKMERGLLMESIDEVRISEMADGIRWAHRNNIRRAATIGTLAHKYAEDTVDYMLGRGPKPVMPLNESAATAAGAFEKWVEEKHIRFIDAEFRVYSREWDYAGTVDSEIESEGKRYICDLKTAKGIYEEHVFQVGAYAIAHTEETGRKLDGAIIIRIDKVTGKFHLKNIPGPALYTVGDLWTNIRCAKYSVDKMKDMMKYLDKGVGPYAEIFKEDSKEESEPVIVAPKAGAKRGSKSTKEPRRSEN